MVIKELTIKHDSKDPKYILLANTNPIPQHAAYNTYIKRVIPDEHVVYVIQQLIIHRHTMIKAEIPTIR